jgi:hypothetical protein
VADATPVATAAVEVTVLGIEHLHKSGNLLAFVTFEMTIANVTIRVQGCQIRRGPPGEIELTPPMFRSGNGTWLPSIEMPNEVMLSVLAQLGDEWPPRAPERLPVMVTYKPQLTMAFAPRVVERKE